MQTNPLYTLPITSGTITFSGINTSRILVTGGTGSFGRAYVRHLIETTSSEVVVYSRDEHKQAALAAELNAPERLSFVIGDVRDEVRLREAMGGVDYLVHAAALKTVPGGERNGGEFMRTNVLGTEAVLRAARAAGVTNLLLISTDKAVAPTNTYGMTKALAERLWLQAGARPATTHQVVRGGNVWGSAGSVLQVWRDAVRKGEPRIFVTGADSTRFHVTMPDWVSFVEGVRKNPVPRTISVPRLRAWRLGDLAAAFGEAVSRLNTLSAPIEAVALPARIGDKDHESLVGYYETLHSERANEDIGRVVLNDPARGGGLNPISTILSSDTAERIGEIELSAAVEAFLRARG